MNSRVLYIMAVLFIAAWAIGFFLLGVGIIIHLLLLAAVISIITKLMIEK